VAVDAAAVQRRITGTCNPGQYVRAVNADGTVTCGTDAGGTVTSVSAVTPLQMGGSANAPIVGLRAAETIGFSCQNGGCTVTSTEAHVFCALTKVGWRNFGNTWTGSASCQLTGSPGATWTLTADLPGGSVGTATCVALCF
jgi:hypothetical protein